MVPRKFRTKEARRKARSRAIFFLVLWTTLALLLVWLLLFGLRQEFIRVDSITVSGVRELDTSEIEAVVQSRMDGFFLWSIPKDSTLFVRSADIEHALWEHFPRIRTVSVERASLRGLEITIEERVAGALWCGDVVPPHMVKEGDEGVVLHDGVCYSMDAEGFIFAKASAPYDTAQNRYYSSLEKAEPVGQYVLSSEEFLAWQNFHALMRERTYPVRAFLITDERDVEAYLELPARVLFPRKSNPPDIAERLVATIVSDSFNKTKEAEYVDMRFQNRVFVKYIEDNPEGEAKISTSPEHDTQSASATESVPSVELATSTREEVSVTEEEVSPEVLTE